MAESIAAPTRVRMTPAHGGWGAAGLVASAGAAVTTPSSDLIITGVLTLASGVLVAIVGPFATAWARSRFHRANYRSEQEALNDHLIRELERVVEDNEHLRSQNETLRDENTRLARRRR